MSLHTPAGFDAFVTGLPAVTVNEQWGGYCAKVGGKVFALLGAEAHQLVFKLPEDSFDILITQEGVTQAAYFAKRQWVEVSPGALDEAALAAYLERSHRIVAGKLTRKARAELGLEAYLAAAEGSTA